MFWINRKGLARLTRAALLLLSPVILPAQGPPINTDTAFVNGLEGAAFRSFAFSVRRSGLTRDGQDIADPLDREVSIHGVPIMLPYEIVKNRLVTAAVFPILRKEIRLTRDGRRRTLPTSGLGDAFVISKLLLVQREQAG